VPQVDSERQARRSPSQFGEKQIPWEGQISLEELRKVLKLESRKMQQEDPPDYSPASGRLLAPMNREL